MINDNLKNTSPIPAIVLGGVLFVYLIVTGLHCDVIN